MDAHKNELLLSAMQFVKARYIKMFYINFTDGSFEAIVIPEEEREVTEKCKNISELIDAALLNDRIFNDDLDVFKDAVNIVKARHWVSESDEPYYCSYRSLGGNGEYKYVYLGIVRDSNNYSIGNERAFVFVKDINSLYQKEYDRFMIKVGLTDSFTGLLNKTCYEKDIQELQGGNIGVVFCDINGLKRCNDTKGHAAGDELILRFAEMIKTAFPDYKSYRRSGDEFIIIAYDKDLRDFTQRVLAWKCWLAKDTPIASVGFSVGFNTKSVKELTAKAELAMYADKEMFYEMYPEYKR